MDLQKYDTTTLGIMLQQLMTADQPAEQKIQRALELGASYLDVETGLVAQTFEEGATWKALVSTTEDDSQFSEGTTLDLSNTYCRRVVEDDSSLKVHDATEQGLEDDPAYQIFNVTSYFGTPLYEGDEISGTVCFVGQDSREPFDSEEALFLELLARFIENELVESQYETDLDESLEIVSALTRVLRHNIRNKLTVVRGYLNTQSQDSSQGLSSGVAIEAVDSVINLSEEARKLEQILQESSDRRTVELTREIEQIVATIDDQVPTASITVEIPESLDYFARPTLPLALRELIENAAEHAGDTPEVTIKAAETDEGVIISIQDDGPGLPEDEQTVIAEGTETPLIHSSGLGHWIARTIITKHDGDIETSVSDEGTTVTISLPRTTPSLPTSDSDDQFHTEYDKFRQAFDDAFEAIVVVDDDGRIIESNERAAEVVGIESQEIVGRRVQEFLISDSDQTDILDDLLQEQLELVEVTDIQGDEHVMEYSATPDVVPKQHLLIGRDVTDERNRQRELKQTKEQMEFALDATDTIVWEWNVDSDQATFYPSETELYGTTVETREDFLEVIHPEDRQQVRESLQQALETGEAKHEEVRIKVNGEVRWIEAPGKPVVEADGTTRMIGVVRDITDRKEREQELERMREFFREAEDLGSLGAWEFDADGNHVWTDGTRRIHEVSEGVTPTVEQAIEFYHPEDRETVEQAVEAALETGESFNYEVRLITAQDTQRWVRVRGEVLDTEKPRTVRGFIQDITERKEHKRKLERQNDQLEEIYGRISDAFFALDQDWQFSHLNDPAHEVINPDGRELEGKNIWEEFPAATERKFKPKYEQAMYDQETVSFEEYYPEPLDAWFEVRAYPSDTGLSVYFRDITERKERERKLEQTEARFQALAENFPNGGVHYFDEDLRYQYVAGAAFDPLDTSPEDLEGNTIYEVELYSAEIVDTLESLMETTLAGNEEALQVTYENQIFELRSVPIRDGDGVVRGGFFITQDITDQRRRERELEQQNDQLEQFARIVSHDLRNPLNVAQGRLELALQECDSEHLDSVEGALDRSQKLIDDLLTLSREGNDMADIEPVNLGILAENCWHNVETTEATITVETDQTIHVDRSRLQQFLENLYRNAVEHGGGDVTVVVGDLENGFYVADDGSGIPEDDRKQVFEPGYSTGTEGTGYGLQIVRKIATAHGWDVRVTKGDKGGAQFEITGVEFVDG